MILHMYKSYLRKIEKPKKENISKSEKRLTKFGSRADVKPFIIEGDMSCLNYYERCVIKGRYNCYYIGL